MRRIVATLLIAALIVLLGVFAVIYVGVYDVAATAPHWPVTRWMFETARMRSVEAHAANIAVPPDFGDPAKIPRGVQHFAAHCAVCHGAPGVTRGEIAEGLNPAPPDLASAVKSYTDGELFWIVKHGIKMTGMPAWTDHSDAELWATVAFVRKLPGMSEQEYASLVMASMPHGGHHHGDEDQKERAKSDAHHH
jgi:mono/diheme cytochrome c family protein